MSVKSLQLSIAPNSTNCEAVLSGDVNLTASVPLADSYTVTLDLNTTDTDFICLTIENNNAQLGSNATDAVECCYQVTYVENQCGAVVVQLTKDNNVQEANVGLSQTWHFFWPNGDWEEGLCCVHEEARFAVRSRGLELARPASSVRRGDAVIDVCGRDVPVLFRVKYRAKTVRFHRIPRHSLGHSTPHRDLLVRKDHPILINGKELCAEDLPQAAPVELDTPAAVCTLVTEQRSFVLCEGVPVCTWSRAAWEEFTRSDPRGQTLSWSQQ